MTIFAIQIAISIVLIALILLQERSAGLSGIFGGSGEGFYQTRRGFERILFWGTIVLSVAFIMLAVFQVLR